MKLHEVRKKYLDFFASGDRNHAIIESASLVPKNDPSVLFNTAGMQPLVPYLMGEKHPLGVRLADAQKCVRTGDIDDIGDNRHCTFFEMLGNWSLGDYFKTESINFSYQFLTDKQIGLGLDPRRLYVTVFEGNDDAPRDIESAEIWKKVFEQAEIETDRIYFLPAKNNWWAAGDNGPCGPDTEIFYDVNNIFNGRPLTHDEFVKNDDEGILVEIWNNVFMQFLKKDGVVVGELPAKNVDTGMGLERIAMVMQGVDNVFDTDAFIPVMNIIKNASGEKFQLVGARIIADHMRSGIFMAADGVRPSNKDAGYIMRRLIRRAVVKARAMDINTETLQTIIEHFINYYGEHYNELKVAGLSEIIIDEIKKFADTLESGMKEYQKGIDPFILATTYGFPFEVTKELYEAEGKKIDEVDYQKKMETHQEISKQGSEQKFKGGMADDSIETTRLHTAHHLLLAALQKHVSPDIHQRGSNITPERLRIDFNYPEKVSLELLARVTDQVNEWIKKDLKVVKREMKKEEAEHIGAEHEFGAKYSDIVSVYFIEDEHGVAISKEFCGGPHVESIGDLGTFAIQKEESSSAGVRRIKAALS